MALNRVPEISMLDFTSSDAHKKSRFIDDLFNGLKEYGFIILRDHAINTSVLHKAYQLAEQLFALPAETKKSYQSSTAPGQRGYIPFGKERAKDSPFPDLKEFWHIGREVLPEHRLKKSFPDNIWPKEFADFQSVFQGLYRDLDNTGRVLLQALTVPLGVDADFFLRMTECGSSVLRLLHYPPIPGHSDPHCVRAAAHEDINLITLLVSASSSGLELLTRDGQWLKVETAPDNIIVDSGDMLARITNNVLPATTHRVINPIDANTSRYSMPFFMHPQPDAVLSCLPSCRGSKALYPDIMADDFLMQRLQANGVTK